jgi:hypothetical protein
LAACWAAYSAEKKADMRVAWMVEQWAMHWVGRKAVARVDSLESSMAVQMAVLKAAVKAVNLVGNLVAWMVV